MFRKDQCAAARLGKKLSSFFFPERAPTQGAQDAFANAGNAFHLIGQVNAKRENLKMAFRKIVKYVPQDRGESLGAVGQAQDIP